MNGEAVMWALAALGLCIAGAQVMAGLFERLRQPRLVGEILFGILVGPCVLGALAPGIGQRLFGQGLSGSLPATTLRAVHEIGLLLLMFLSGAEARRVLGSENRKATAWLLGVGTPLPFFLALLLGLVLPLDQLAGSEGSGWPVRLVFSCAVAVTSIPVISRIFADLGILHTRFASVVLGAALLEDIALWGVLAVAMALGAASAGAVTTGADIGGHVAITIAYMAAGLLVAPPVLRRIHDSRLNLVREASPTGYAVLVLLVYTGAAAGLGVSFVLAAFLAGFGFVGGVEGTHRSRFAEPLDALRKVGFGVLIPVYFVVVGSRLELGEGFSGWLLVAFLVGSSVLCLAAVGLAARLAGFRGIEIVNLAVASNARGGPGIVLATVAFDGGLIDGSFFTTLVLTAVLTSQAAGAWLAFVLRRNWPLLRSDLPDLRASGGDPKAQASTVSPLRSSR